MKWGDSGSSPAVLETPTAAARATTAHDAVIVGAAGSGCGVTGEAAIQPDDATWARLMLVSHNVAKRFFQGRQDYEDAVQEAMIRTYVRWATASARNVDAWVTTTTLNVCREHLRRARRGTGPWVPAAPSKDSDSRVLHAIVVADALWKLTRHQRQVVIWRYVFDKNVEETAKALELTEAGVRDACHKAGRRLRRTLGDDWRDLL